MKTIITIIIILFTSITYAGDKFTKISASGAELSDSATEWSCVKQNTTGLIWEVKTDDGGLRDMDWTYSYYDSAPSYGEREGTENAGRCDNNRDCDTQKYTQRVNDQRLCGYNGWRLPSNEELSEQQHPLCQLDTEYPDFFPNSNPNTTNNNYTLYWYDTNNNVSDVGFVGISSSCGRFGGYSKHSAVFVRLVSLAASIKSDSDKLFNWAETRYPDLFSPSGQKSEMWNNYYFRYYPGAGNYLGVNNVDGDVYVLGDTFGGLIRIDTLVSLVQSMSTHTPEDTATVQSISDHPEKYNCEEYITQPNANYDCTKDGSSVVIIRYLDGVQVESKRYKDGKLVFYSSPSCRNTGEWCTSQVSYNPESPKSKNVWWVGAKGESYNYRLSMSATGVVEHEQISLWKEDPNGGKAVTDASASRDNNGKIQYSWAEWANGKEFSATYSENRSYLYYNGWLCKVHIERSVPYRPDDRGFDECRTEAEDKASGLLSQYKGYHIPIW